MWEQRHRAVFRRWLCGGREDYFKEAAQRKASIERSQEAAEERKQQMEIAYRKQAMAEALANHVTDTSRVTYTSSPETMGSAIAAYERNIMETSGILK